MIQMVRDSGTFTRVYFKTTIFRKFFSFMHIGRDRIRLLPETDSVNYRGLFCTKASVASIFNYEIQLC